MANLNKRAFYVNGKMLKEIITEKGLTQADVYKAIGIGENTIYRVIKYDRMENESDFLKMCQYLNIEPEVLLKNRFSDYPLSKFKDPGKYETINKENIDQYITRYGKGFGSYGMITFNDVDIYRFFEDTPLSLSLSGEEKAFLFSKIIDSREIFLTLLYKFIDTKSGDEDINDFYKRFTSWFDRNIKNKGLDE